jgi:hypothetical protein
MWVRLGNAHPFEAFKRERTPEEASAQVVELEDQGVPFDVATSMAAEPVVDSRPHPFADRGPTATTIELPDGLTAGELLAEVQLAWSLHAAPGTMPTWIASSDPDAQAGLAYVFGCPAGEPSDAIADPFVAELDAVMPGADHTVTVPAPDEVPL